MVFVKISVRKTKHIILFLEDTGIGIPNHSSIRAFERFYRVDKSHNRLGGGSGLGLAIVKHVVQAHGVLFLYAVKWVLKAFYYYVTEKSK